MQKTLDFLYSVQYNEIKMVIIGGCFLGPRKRFATVLLPPIADKITKTRYEGCLRRRFFVGTGRTFPRANKQGVSV